MPEQDVDRDLEVLLAYLRRSRGFDFTGYKRTSLSRRIEKRMQAVGADGYLSYLDHLEVDPRSSPTCQHHPDQRHQLLPGPAGLGLPERRDPAPAG